MAKETVGEFLKRERELRQIDLKEVSEGTKISVTRLRLIEQNQFEELPAEVFVRGFIKSYAEYIGIDPNEAILKLEEDLREQGFKTTKHEIPASHFDLERHKGFGPILIGAIVAAVLIAGVIIYFFISDKTNGTNSLNSTALSTTINFNAHGNSSALSNTSNILSEPSDQSDKEKSLDDNSSNLANMEKKQDKKD